MNMNDAVTDYFDKVTIESSDPMSIFVYGTLRPGEGNYGWSLEGRTVNERDGYLANSSMYTIGGFPYVIEEADGNGVRGTIIDVDPAHLDSIMAALDNLEGTRYGSDDPKTGKMDDRNHYNRVLRLVKVGDNHFVKAWVYLPPVADNYRIRTLQKVDSGDWMNQEKIRFFRGHAVYKAPRATSFDLKYDVDSNLTDVEKEAIEQFVVSTYGA